MSAYDAILIAILVSVVGTLAMQLSDWVGQYFGFTIRDGKFRWRWGKIDQTDIHSRSPRAH